jgi:general secretion pathway protein L
MSDWLLLRMPGAAATASWLVADSSGRPLTAPGSGTLQQASAAAVGRRVAVLLPPTDVLLAEVELPLKGGARASQIVPYALEEQLVGDVEAQHFALGARNEATGRTAVAVIAHAELEQLLQTLRASGIEAAAVVSEAALVPQGPNHATVLLDGDTLCIVPPGAAHAAVLPAADVGAALELAVGAEALPGTTILCVATPLDWQRRSAEIEALRSRCAGLKVQLANSGLLPWLAPQFGAGAAVNLLQGRYALRTTWSGQWQRWRVAAVLAGALLLLHVAGELWTLAQLRRAERELNVATEEFANRVMPGEGGGANLRKRAEQRLLAAQRGDDGSGLMSALAAIAGAVPAAGGGASIKNLQFQGGALEVQLRANDAESLERLSQQLRAAGWRAEITSGGAVSGGYEGRVRLARS